MNIRTAHRASNGFTIIEILVVITVIGILATLTVVGYNGYQNQARVTTIKSDLSDSADLLEIYAARNGNEYPHDGGDMSGVDLPNSGDNYHDYYTNRDDALANNRALEYCLQAGNEKIDNFYHISSTSDGIQEGECSEFLASITPPPPPPSCDEYNRGQVLPNNGGTIVYKASTPQSWGCYLVAAGPTTHSSGWWRTGQNTSNFSESRYPWGCQGTSITGVFSNNIGGGRQNTQNIISGCSGTHAARKAASYRGGGFTDWYLPNRTEMIHLINYNNSNNAQHGNANNPSLYLGTSHQPDLNKLSLKQGGGWISGRYWTSTQSSSNQATAFSTYGRNFIFNGGYMSNINKQCTGCVDAMMFTRPVRVF